MNKPGLKINHQWKLWSACQLVYGSLWYARSPVMKMYRRLAIAVVLLIVVFLYGTVGHYCLLYPGISWGDCALRTVVLLSTVNEAFTVDELGAAYDLPYRVFTITLIVFGIAVMLYALSTITAFFVEGELQEILRQRQMSKEIGKIKSHIIVCGAGETGHYIADELRVSRRPFVMIERDHERIERLRAEGIAHVEGDAAEEHVLEEAGIMRARGLAVALPTDPENIFVTITARQMNRDLTIIAKGIEQSVEKKLLAAGADKVVRPAHIGGMRMASELIRPTAVTFMDKMLRDPVDTTRIDEILVSENCGLDGHTIATSRFRQRTGLQVVAVRNPGEEKYCYQPATDTPLGSGTSLIVLGTTDDIAKARKMAKMS